MTVPNQAYVRNDARDSLEELEYDYPTNRGTYVLQVERACLESKYSQERYTRGFL